uniref:Uncharacterized protein n=1 Tax=Myoviridae sp. ctJ2i1 TaxID=2825079 RepID=A0A8S5V1P9_9CAUD|nr:MAG TPA: hypothetical protein [Myoviridae sp. ctJ2i1]
MQIFCYFYNFSYNIFLIKIIIFYTYILHEIIHLCYIHFIERDPRFVMNLTVTIKSF